VTLSGFGLSFSYATALPTMGALRREAVLHRTHRRSGDFRSAPPRSGVILMALRRAGLFRCQGTHRAADRRPRAKKLGREKLYMKNNLHVKPSMSNTQIHRLAWLRAEDGLASMGYLKFYFHGVDTGRMGRSVDVETG
jgi:hypothetical protein